MPSPPLPAGFRAAGVTAGIKASGSPDLALLVSELPCAAAGTFTTNRIAAAPVQYDRAVVPSDHIRAIVVNSGNANAATGAEGLANVRRTVAVACKLLGLKEDRDPVLVASTGVIGHQLPMEKIESGLSKAAEALASDEPAFRGAATAILTTDTRPKMVSLHQEIEGKAVTVFGMAKGAAMIGPRMATMLGFLLTDARVGSGALQGVLSEAVEQSFNCISVEGHTSTNDTVLLLANGANGGERLQGDGLKQFAQLVRQACIRLARMIPEDGEGAQHVIEIRVEGCASRDDAREIARAVADSPLVKTAIHGADPNWGRIVSAAGYSGVPFEENELSLWLNDVLLYRDGAPVAFEAAAVSKRLKEEREVTIRLLLKQGEASITFWTCDLTAEYVRLNADYTT